MSDQIDTSLGMGKSYGSDSGAKVLCSIPRESIRGKRDLASDKHLLVYGEDLWTAYELSWLKPNGLPQVAIGEFAVPCNSTHIVESKSLKLYLNSFNQRSFDSIKALEQVLIEDLSHTVGAQVEVNLFSLATYNGYRCISEPKVYCIDNLDISISSYNPDSSLLCIDGEEEIKETLCSHLLRTNCPVTNQPDWGSVYVTYRGVNIYRPSLLAYLVSYRLYQGFHESCVDQIFHDVLERCYPLELTVSARYLRRGGIDINPIRSTNDEYISDFRHVRQ